MTEVRLEIPELTNAAIIGVLRQVSAIQRDRPAAYGAENTNAWSIGIEGTAAEMAVAKYLGCYWQPLAPGGDLSKMRADIGDYIEVRSTLRTDGSLIVHERDGDSKLFYLVVCSAPVYTICGWLLGHEAKQREFWRSDIRHPAFLVPQQSLHECAAGTEVPEWIRASWGAAWALEDLPF
jgi:hypothetical protein